ncbi:MAG: 16S rRNA (guanine(527)-N(7))-methyltransferase RsmG [Phycisphaerales bacterium]|nr:16S rRNA (guanine(527)-N(7))-methyltransferase RsmG [Phycisphaerales bacterium]|tara:strand:+ start:22767 stop:23516 length:750 start_codon:yes stop_codon:yes gene_type:complete
MTEFKQDDIPASFLEAAQEMGLAFDTGDLDKLCGYLSMLYEANQQMNLTAIREPHDVWTRHVQDSLSLFPTLASVKSSTIIDVGSGGGLPGIPLAIVKPESRFVLLEATGKKATFLQSVVDRLSLGNVRVVAQRAEEAAAHGSAHRGAFDVVIARAVGPLPVLLELTVPFARVDGIVAAIKGERAAAEVEASAGALLTLRSEVVDLHKGSTGTLVLIRKTASTPRIYPRRSGEPKRRPLGEEAADHRVR